MGRTHVVGTDAFRSAFAGALAGGRSAAGSGEQRRARPRRLRGRVRLGGRLRAPRQGRLHRQHRPEPDDLARRRRRASPSASSPRRTARSFSSATRTAASSSPKPATIRRSRALVYIAAFAPDKGESVSRADQGSRRPAHRCRRSCRRRTASCSSTRRSSPRRSRPTSMRRRPRSWPTRRCRGASTRWAARSASRRGRRSRAGTWSPPTTG